VRAHVLRQFCPHELILMIYALVNRFPLWALKGVTISLEERIYSLYWIKISVSIECVCVCVCVCVCSCFSISGDLNLNAHTLMETRVTEGLNCHHNFFNVKMLNV